MKYSILKLEILIIFKETPQFGHKASSFEFPFFFNYILRKRTETLKSLTNFKYI